MAATTIAPGIDFNRLPVPLPSNREKKKCLFERPKDVYACYQKANEEMQKATGMESRLKTPEDTSGKTALNEVRAILQYAQEINPTLPKIASALNGVWDIEQQFEAYGRLLKQPDEQSQAKIRTIQESIEKISQWNAFALANGCNQLSLEYMVEYGYTGAGLVNRITALAYAEYLYQNQEMEISESSCEKFFTSENATIQKIKGFCTQLKILVVPRGDQSELKEGEEAMSISASVQHFRKSAVVDVAGLFKEDGDIELEEELNKQFNTVQTRVDAILEKIQQYDSIENLYVRRKTLKEHPVKTEEEAAEEKELDEIDSHRRFCAGMGWLFALELAVKSGDISRWYYERRRESINGFVKLFNEMDRCNLEIYLGHKESYKENAIPSTYVFFAKLEESFKLEQKSSGEPESDPERGKAEVKKSKCLVQ